MAYRSEPEKTVVVSNGSGGAAWLLIGALVVAIIGGIWLYNEGIIGGGADIDVEITPPTVETPAE